jgi:hypothetical protein
MPEIVTIEGTVTPCVELPRFKRKTVELDEHTRRLITKGFVVIVARHGDPEAELAALDAQAEQPEQVTPVEVLAPTPAPAAVPEPTPAGVPAAETPPA